MTDLGERAAALDAADPLAGFRDRFALPEGVTYLDGNSLGALPRETAGRVARTVQAEWGEGLIRSWNSAGWIEAPARLGAKVARLIGAGADEVVVADSTSANLFKLLSAALDLDARHRVILSEPGNFPTDLYVAQGLAATRPGVEVRTLPRDGIVAAAGPDTVLLLTHVHYKTGERFDMAAVTRAARDRGSVVVWDLSHSVGAVELDLAGAGAELAVGCGYKYLNGGPGAPAFLYAARDIQPRLRSPLTGWMGHAAPFAFGDDYAPAPGIARFLCGTPPILGMAALEAGLDLFLEAARAAGSAALWAKSARLCELFIEAVETGSPEPMLVSPRDATARGSHVSFAHPQAHAVVQALIERGIIGDFRAPDVMRFGFAPLYNTHAEAVAAGEAVADVLASGTWDEPRFHQRAAVT